jgi:AraC-like DNA-binding protein
MTAVACSLGRVPGHRLGYRILSRTLAQTRDRQAAYFGQIFRKQVGMTVHQWITRVRLDHAAALIRDGVKIEAVALMVGYRSKKNFYRQFRRRYATTPQRYGRQAGGVGPVVAG